MSVMTIIVHSNLRMATLLHPQGNQFLTIFLACVKKVQATRKRVGIQVVCCENTSRAFTRIQQTKPDHTLLLYFLNLGKPPSMITNETLKHGSMDPMEVA